MSLCKQRVLGVRIYLKQPFGTFSVIFYKTTISSLRPMCVRYRIVPLHQLHQLQKNSLDLLKNHFFERVLVAFLIFLSNGRLPSRRYFGFKIQSYLTCDDSFGLRPQGFNLVFRSNVQRCFFDLSFMGKVDHFKVFTLESPKGFVRVNQS